VNLYTTVLNTLRQKSNLSEEQAQSLANEINELIEQKLETSSLPNVFVQRALGEHIFRIQQIMVAQSHGTIQNAAQYFIQILEEDPRSIIPTTFREYCPYPGLSAFAEGDSRYFHGREDDIESFLGYISRPIVALTGDSGVGKSSFLSAGIIPRLKQNFGDDASYLSFEIHSNTNLLHNFAEYLHLETEESTESIVQAIRQQDNALLTCLQNAFGIKKRVFFVLDQFESLFIDREKKDKNQLIQPDEANEEIPDQQYILDRRRLLDNFLFTETHQNSCFLTTIIATRDDADSHSILVDNRKRLVDIIKKERFYLSSLNKNQMRLAIENPLTTFNEQYQQKIEYQAGLIDLIIGEFGNLESSLPLVQYLLRLLWTEKRHLTHFAYNSLEGLNVLNRHAQDIYTSFLDEDQPQVKSILIALVRTGIRGEYARKRIRLESLLLGKNPHQQQRIKHILHQLSNPHSRIISERKIGNTTYLELTHEIVLRQWDFLKAQIELHKKRINAREELLDQAEKWWVSTTRFGKDGDPGELFIGNKFERAKDYIEDKAYLNDAEGSIVACYEASKRYNLKRFRRGILIGLIVIIIVFLLLNKAVQAEQEAVLQAENNVAIEANATTAAITRQAEQTREFQIRITEQAELANQVQLKATAEAGQVVAEEESRISSSISESKALANASEMALDNNNYNAALLLAIESGKTYPTTDAYNALNNLIYTNGIPQITLSHNIGFTNARWNADESLLFTVEGQFLNSSAVYVWDTASGWLISTLMHDNFIWDSEWSSDGEHILTASQDGTARIWNAINGEIVQSFSHGNAVELAKWSADETILLTEAAGGGIKLWDALTGREIIFPRLPEFQSGQWNPFNNQLIVWTRDDLYVLDVSSGEEIFKFDKGLGITSAVWHSDRILRIEYGNEKMELWSSFEREKVRELILNEGSYVLEWWNASMAFIHNETFAEEVNVISETLRFSYPHECPVLSASWHPIEPYYYVLTHDCNGVHIWRGPESPLFTISGAFSKVQWAPDGKMILTQSQDSDTLQLWSFKSGLEVTRLHHDPGFKEVYWNQTGDHLLTIASPDAIVWDLSKNIILPLEIRGNDWIVNSNVNATNTMFLAESLRGNVSIRNLDSLEEAISFDEKSTNVPIRFSPDGTKITVVENNEGANVVKVYDLITQDEIHSFPHINEIDNAIWSPTGSTILTISNGETFIWDFLTGELRLQLTDDIIAFDLGGWGKGEDYLITWGREKVDTQNRWVSIWDGADGHLISTWPYQSKSDSELVWNPETARFLVLNGNSGMPELWDVEFQNVLLTFPHKATINDARWNSSSSQIITAGNDNTARVWDAVTGIEVLNLAHDHPVLSAWWFDTDSLLMTISEDNTIHIWDALTGENKHSINGDGSQIILASWDESKNQVFVITKHGRIFRYFLSMENLINEACTHISQNFTAEEWQRYRGDVYTPTCPKQPITYNTLLTLLDLDQIHPVEEYIHKILNGEINHTFSAHQWDNLCRHAIIQGFASELLIACDTAIAMMPSYANFYDTRGVALGTLGMFEDSISNFEQYLLLGEKWVASYDLKSRQDWVSMLRNKENPFTEEVINSWSSE
jgi:WD40 repeat protein